LIKEHEFFRPFMADSVAEYRPAAFC